MSDEKLLTLNDLFEHKIKALYSSQEQLELATAQVIAHYEIANYGAARNYAQRLGYEQAVGFLNKAIEEEKETDAKLSQLAESTVNTNDTTAGPRSKPSTTNC